MAEITLLGRCPTCGQPRAIAARCVCGCPVWRHQHNRAHRRTACYGCGCRTYTEHTEGAQP